MQPETAVGITHFIGQVDGVGRAILVLLTLMSIATWYLVVTKTLSAILMRRRTRRYLETFWNSPSLAAVAAHLGRNPPDEPFSNLTLEALRAAEHHQRHGAERLGDAGGKGEFVTRAIRRVIDEETARFESGLTVLASIGSTAPFVGLFGTMWGVYHALVSIGMSGQGTLDKVAGPVGEALIMTGLGLAVAIPAVLAYNFCVRGNRVLLAQLDSFAHDLFAFLATGSRVESGVAPAELERAAAAGAA